ncbi:MAG: outer membrane protein assembly factor BamD [Saprospiraceae bacterium]|nr:MAG: outer membrane assembly lipoprotein YfiO [Bacteroidetes bacterium OLB9]MCO6463870.1 outer membrane protein assembly factor BamD [Saprospiraceae bacterium]MCZ2339550.1 outer membrane protein assembly factor BamD [Chitinophagales bacterium]
MRLIQILIIFVAVLTAGCKSEFETLRTSNQPEKIYKAANKYYDEKLYDRAIALWDVIIQHYRGRQEAEELFYKYAYAHYYQGDYILASVYFKNFATTFANSVNKQEADFMASYSNYKMSPNYKLDQSYTLKAIEGFEQFATQYPGTERTESANKLIDEMRKKLEKKSFEQGVLYYKMGQYQAAMTSFENTLKDFAESDQVEEIRFLILKSSFILASNSIYEKQEERYNKTLDNYNTFIRRHPDSKFAKEAKSIEKQTLLALKKLKG